MTWPNYEAAVDAIPQWIRDTLGDMLVPESLVRIISDAALDGKVLYEFSGDCGCQESHFVQVWPTKEEES